MGRPRNADKYLKYWQTELGLPQWDIVLLRSKVLYTEKQRLAEVVWTAERESAVITLATDRQIKGDVESLEGTILHEILHVRLHGHLSMEDFSNLVATEAELNRLENTINALTKTMLKLKGGKI